MGKKTDFVKNKLHDIKTKFDYATHAGSKFETKVKDSLSRRIIGEYEKCAEANNWSKNNLEFNGSIEGDTIIVDITAPTETQKLPDENALIQSVIDEATKALKSTANKNESSISQYNWKKPTTFCSAIASNSNKIIDKIRVRIMGDKKEKA